MGTEMIVNRPGQVGNASGGRVLVQRKLEVQVAEQDIYLPVFIGYDAFELKTVRAVSSREGSTISVDVYADKDKKEPVYRSLTERTIHDIVSAPILDAEKDQTSHVFIRSNAQTTVTLTLNYFSLTTEEEVL